MKETPFFFPNGSYQLFGVLHEPEKESNGCGFVFCHPFAEEKLWTHRVFVNFSRKLASIGYTVLRFDFMGHGDSEGKFAESSIETRLSDIRCAIQTLHERNAHIEGVGLLGLRLGATLAALVAEEEASLSRLVLWEPVVKGAQYMREMFRINMATQSSVYKEIRHDTEALIKMLQEGRTVNIEGYEIKLPLHKQMIDIDLLNSKKQFSGKTLIVQINKKEGMGTKKISKLGEQYPDATVLAVVEQPFWKEIREYYAKADGLYDVTVNWLRAICLLR